jgi:hypothetical protein
LCLIVLCSRAPESQKRPSAPVFIHNLILLILMRTFEQRYERTGLTVSVVIIIFCLSAFFAEWVKAQTFPEVDKSTGVSFLQSQECCIACRPDASLSPATMLASAFCAAPDGGFDATDVFVSNSTNNGNTWTVGSGLHPQIAERQ